MTFFRQRERELKEQHEKGGAQFFYDVTADPDEEDPVDRGKNGALCPIFFRRT